MGRYSCIGHAASKANARQLTGGRIDNRLQHAGRQPFQFRMAIEYGAQRNIDGVPIGLIKQNILTRKIEENRARGIVLFQTVNAVIDRIINLLIFAFKLRTLCIPCFLQSLP